MLDMLNVDLLVDQAESIAKYSTTDGPLHRRYAHAQRRLLEIPLIIEPERPAVTFARPEWVHFLSRRKVIAPEALKSVGDFSGERRCAIQRLLEEMRDFLGVFVPESLQLFDLLVSEIVVLNLPKPEAGSHSAAVGMIWVNPKRHWTTEYCAELVVHEVGHQEVFLTDMVQGLMQDMELLESETTRCYSAIRKTFRFFDSAFHAAYVAARMAWFHSRLARAGFPNQMAKMADCLEHGQLGVDDLQAVASRQREDGRPILTPYGEELLAAMSDYFHSPDLDLAPLPIAA